MADGARVVLIQAPKALDALREIAELVAASAAPDVTVLVGGRVKHMTHAMNDVLRDSFTDVSATLARQKSRVLVAPGPKPGPSSFPRSQDHPDLGLTVCAHGAAFAGTKIDIGTRTLLGCLDRMAPAGTALDLGAGPGSWPSSSRSVGRSSGCWPSTSRPPPWPRSPRPPRPTASATGSR